MKQKSGLFLSDGRRLRKRVCFQIRNYLSGFAGRVKMDGGINRIGKSAFHLLVDHPGTGC
jgi:hypothetical protein